MIDFFGRKFRKNMIWHSENDSEDQNAAADWAKITGDECEMSMDAQLMTSQTGRRGTHWVFDSTGLSPADYDLHAPVIDLDVAHHYEPSTTPGHGHLYINKDMTFEDMMKLLDVMVEVGIVQPGFRDAARIRGWAAVRTPWTAK